MATLEALYRQEPFWIWLAVACLFVSLALATGSGRLIWPASAAAVIALIEAAGVRVGPVYETLLFGLLLAGALAWLMRRGRPAAPAPRAAHLDPAQGRRTETERLVGRIGRTRGAFANGVGRVWIEDAEWAADLEGGEETLPDGAPVRVVRVIGGIRLQVHALGTR